MIYVDIQYVGKFVDSKSRLFLKVMNREEPLRSAIEHRGGLTLATEDIKPGSIQQCFQTVGVEDGENALARRSQGRIGEGEELAHEGLHLCL